MKEDISKIIERIKKLKHIDSDAKVAELLGMERSGLYGHIKKKTIPYKRLSAFSQQEGIPIAYILYGEGAPHSSESYTPDNHALSQHESPVMHPRFNELMGKTIKIINSHSGFARVLETNIDAFNSALIAIEDLEKTKMDVHNLMVRVSQLEKLLLERQEDCEAEEGSGGQLQ